MNRHTGLDAHSQTCTLVVMGPSEKRLHEQVVETNGKALVAFLQTIPGRRELCFEESSSSDWLFEVLSPHVDRVVVLQPEKRQGNKSDSIDAWKLADYARVGGPGRHVYKAPQAFAQLREAVRASRAITRDIVRAKNRFKAVFRSRGVQTPGANVYRPDHREDWLAMLPSHRRKHAQFLGWELDALVELHAEVE